MAFSLSLMTFQKRCLFEIWDDAMHGLDGGALSWELREYLFFQPDPGSFSEQTEADYIIR